MNEVSRRNTDRGQEHDRERDRDAVLRDEDECAGASAGRRTGAWRGGVRRAATGAAETGTAVIEAPPMNVRNRRSRSAVMLMATTKSTTASTLA